MLERLAALLVVFAMLAGCGGTDGDRAGALQEEGGQDGGRDATALGQGGEGSEMRFGIERAGDSSADAAVAAARTVLFIGTSLTAGLGVAEEQSFPLLIEQRIEEAGLAFRVVNAGVSGETSAGALRRIDWLLRQPLHAVVLETGANDMLRGVDPGTTEDNIQSIIDRVRAAHPDVPIVLAGMLALPNLGEAYGREFEAIYPRLAEANDLVLIPFLLEGVGGERELNQGDGVHPNAAGHRVITDTVWDVLEPVLRDLEAADS